MMDKKTKFLKVLEKGKYFDSIKHICDECWEDDVFRAWKDIFVKFIEIDIKVCIASHVVLVRWYQLKKTIEEVIDKYVKTPHLPAQGIIERDKLFFLIFSLYYATYEHLGKLPGLVRVEDGDFGKILGRIKESLLFRLRQATQHSILESYFFDCNDSEGLKIIKKTFGNDTFNQHFQGLAELSNDNNQIDNISVEKMLKDELDAVSKNVAFFFGKLKEKASSIIPQNNNSYSPQILTSTVSIPGEVKL